MKYLIIIFAIISFVFCCSCKDDIDTSVTQKETSTKANTPQVNTKDDIRTTESKTDKTVPVNDNSKLDNDSDKIKNDTNQNTDEPKDEPQAEPEKVAEIPEDEAISEIKIQNEFQSSVLKATKIIIFDSDQGNNKKEIIDKKLILPDL